MKLAADYRALARDALRGRWKTAVLAGLLASALGANIVNATENITSNANRANQNSNITPGGYPELFSQANGGRLLAVLVVIPGIVKSYSYAMAPYIMAEHPALTANEAITESRRIMDGNKWRLFCLDFSFIGWELLCVLPMLVGFSWVVAAFSDAAAMGVVLVTLLAVPLSAGFFVVRPYEEAAWAVFYRDITAAEAETE